jgi:hypothetical protein
MQSMGIYKLLLDSIQRHGARNMKGDEAMHGACSFASVDMRVVLFIHEYDSGRAFCHRSEAERRRADPTAGQLAETRPDMVYAQSQCLLDTLHVWYFVWKLCLLPSCIVLRIMSICSADHVTSSCNSFKFRIRGCQLPYSTPVLSRPRCSSLRTREPFLSHPAPPCWLRVVANVEQHMLIPVCFSFIRICLHPRLTMTINILHLCLQDGKECICALH